MDSCTEIVRHVFQQNIFHINNIKMAGITEMAKEEGMFMLRQRIIFKSRSNIVSPLPKEQFLYYEEEHC